MTQTNILTLHLDADSQAHFDAMRQAHYPAALNQIAAHLTLFHTLPDQPGINDLLEQLTATHTDFTLRVTGLRSLGRGVAYTLASPDLLALHKELAAAFASDLTAQDKQRFQPHIVVQNKVTPERARTLLTNLQHDFQALEVRAEGLHLWHYLNGPWKLAKNFSFRS